MRISSVLRSSFSKLIEYTAKPPSTHVPAWTRLAVKIKTPSGQQQQHQQQQSPDGKHLDSLQRSGKFDIEDSLGKLEEELMEEIAGALGKTGDKCVWHFKEMNRAKLAWEDSLSSSSSSSSPAQVQAQEHAASLPSFAFPVCISFPLLSLSGREQIARNFNQARHLFEDARRELIIHRQACGFTANNYQLVEEIFPLPLAIQVMTAQRVCDLKRALINNAHGHADEQAQQQLQDDSQSLSVSVSLDDESSLRAALRGLGINHIRNYSSPSSSSSSSLLVDTSGSSSSEEAKLSTRHQAAASQIPLDALSRPQLLDLLRHCIER